MPLGPPFDTRGRYPIAEMIALRVDTPPAHLTETKQYLIEQVLKAIRQVPR
jgi:hypothetical protein